MKTNLVLRYANDAEGIGVHKKRIMIGSNGIENRTSSELFVKCVYKRNVYPVFLLRAYFYNPVRILRTDFKSFIMRKLV